MPPDLSSVHAKLSRADFHADTMKHEVMAWRDTDPYTVRQKSNANFSRHSLVFVVKNEPPLEKWSLIFGDLVHNLRSALDHLVYAIAAYEGHAAGPLTEHVARNLMFVIKDSPHDFRSQHFRFGNSKSGERYISAGVVDAIESVQPYLRPHHELPPLLAVLRDFDDRDKHRLLHIAIEQLYKGNVEIHNPAGFQSAIGKTYVGELAHGQEIAFVTVSPPSVHVKLDFQGSVLVTVNHGAGPSLGERSDIASVINLLLAEVREVVGIVAAAVR